MTESQQTGRWYKDPLLDVDLVRFWSAAAFIAFIAAFAAIVILRFAGDVFNTPLLVTAEGGADELVPLTDGRVFWSVVVITGTAAAMLNMMLYAVPNATRFFVVLGTVVLGMSLIWPFSLDVGNEETMWLVAIHVVVGIIIMSLLTGIVGMVTRPYQASDNQVG